MADKDRRLLAIARLIARRAHSGQTYDMASLKDLVHTRALLQSCEQLQMMFARWLQMHTEGNIQDEDHFASTLRCDSHVKSAVLEAARTYRLLGKRMPERGSSAPPQTEAPTARNEMDGRPDDVLTGASVILVPNRAADSGGVAEGIDTTLKNRRVAVKTTAHREYHSLLNEADLMGSFVHPHIIPVLSLATDSSGAKFYVMPLLTGGSLADAIEKHHRGTLSKPERQRSMYTMLQHVITAAKTVHYAHTLTPAVIHRDIKPQNLMLDESGNLYVVDWGEAYQVDPRRFARPTPHRGTFCYAAPEQWEGNLPGDAEQLSVLSATFAERCKPSVRERVRDGLERQLSLVEALRQAGVDPAQLLETSGVDVASIMAQQGRRADVYSLGATLYHVVTGQPPFGGQHDGVTAGEAELDQRKKTNAYVPAEDLSADCSAELAAIVHKAMSLKPEDRYATAAAFADDLERVAGQWLDEPIAAFEPGKTPLRVRSRRLVRRHAGFAAAALCLVATLVLLLGLWGGERHHAVLAARTQAVKDVDAARQRGELAVAAARSEGQKHLRAQRDKAAKDLEAERERSQASQTEAQAAKASTTQLQRTIGRLKATLQLERDLDHLQLSPRRELTPAERAAVQRVARRVELEFAKAEATRLQLAQPEPSGLASLLLRQGVLQRTSPAGTPPVSQPRHVGDELEQKVIDSCKASFRSEPETEIGRYTERRLNAICRESPEVLRRILSWDALPSRPDPVAVRFASLFADLESGGLRGIPQATGKAMAVTLAQDVAALAMRGLLSGSMDGLGPAAAGLSEELIDQQSLRIADGAILEEVGRRPSEEAIVKRWSTSPPADATSKGIDAATEKTLAQIQARRHADLANVAMRSGHTRSQVKKSADPNLPVENPEYALEYADLLPAQSESRAQTAYDRLLGMQMARHLPVDVAGEVQRYKRIGSAQAAQARAYSFGKLQGFHRVGGTAASADACCAALADD